LADKQFLRIQIDKAEYYLPSGTSVAIEKRESLVVDNSRSIVSAWRQSPSGRWPAYCVDEELIPSLRQDWVRAVFVQAQPHPVGIIGDEIQLVAVDALDVTPFTPLGPPATSAGHLFSAAIVRKDQVSMILEPQALVSYLTALGG
jgi:hypothetical protein